SGTPGFAPPPLSPAPSAPRPRIFLTVSGVAAPRGSAGSSSAGTATFMMPPAAAGLGTSRAGREGPPPAGSRVDASGEENGHADEDHNHNRPGPLQRRQYVLIGSLSHG